MGSSGGLGVAVYENAPVDSGALVFGVFDPLLHAAEFALQGLDVLLAVEYIALQAADAGLVSGVGGGVVAARQGAAFGQGFLRGFEGAAFVGQFLFQNHAAAVAAAWRGAGGGCQCRCGRGGWGGAVGGALGCLGAWRGFSLGADGFTGAFAGVGADAGQVGLTATCGGLAAVTAVAAIVNGGVGGGCA